MRGEASGSLGSVPARTNPFDGGGSTLRRVCSIFSQILQLIPRDGFEAAVREHKAERHARGFSSWGQFVAMLFCQLAQAKSLREITEGLQASEGKLRHLGLPEAPARSTLAYANSHRPWQLFEAVFHELLAHCQKRLGVAKAGAKLGLPGKLLSLDATVIDLCAAVFDWAQFRTTKGAVKLHLLLDHDGYLPCYAVVTEGKVHENPGRPETAIAARDHAGVRPWLHRLRMVPAPDPRRGAFRDAPERQCDLHPRGAA